MVPLKIHRSKKVFPFITYLLIIINSVLFIATYYSASFEQVIEYFAFKQTSNSYWSWLTSMFLHISWFHLVGNMIFLYIFGSLLENAISRYKYLLIYLTGGLVSAFLQGFLILQFIGEKSSQFSVIGSSGAIFALIGIVMVRFRQNQVTWYMITPLLLLELIFLPGTGNYTLIVFFSGIVIFLIILAYGFTHDVPITQLIFVWPVFTITAMATGISYLLIQFGLGILQLAHGEIGGIAYGAHVGGLLAGLVMAGFLGANSEAAIDNLEQEAKSLFRQSRYTEAAEKYEKAIKAGPKEAFFRHKAAKAWALSGQTNKSTIFFKKAFDLYYDSNRKEEASQVYEDIINYLPQHFFDARTHLKFASLCQAQYKLEAALKGYSKIVEKQPFSREAELALIRTAQVYQKMGDTNKASQTYADFLKKYPQSSWCSLAKQWLGKLQTKPA